MEKVILSIDCGTQSLRALLFNNQGDLLDRVQIKYEPYFSVKPGWAEQDPEMLWQSLCNACKRLKQNNPDVFSRIIGVGVTTLRSSMVNVDKQGVPLDPIITWLDQRKAKKVYYPKVLMKIVYKIVGMEEAVDRLQMNAPCNWIRQNKPEIWEKTYKYLQISGFFNFRLTGKFLDSVGSQIGYIPFDYRKMKWARKGEFTSLLFPIEKEKLPDIVKPGEVIGKITKQASEETGIAEGIDVIAAGSDKGCETIGMGIDSQKMVSLSFGTTATVQTISKKYFETIGFISPYPASIPGYYNPEVEVFRGYWMITWFKNEFAHKEVLEAEKKGILSEVELDSLLKKVPPGSMGLIVQPYWGPGLKHPEAKGAMIGFGGIHKKAHIYRAIIEGLAYALLDGMHSIEKRGRVKVEKVAVSGGASQSDEICQITADIFNLPLVRGKVTETSGLGAAIITAVGTGIYPDFKSAIKKMVHYDKIFKPNSENIVIYDRLFKSVYLGIYDVLKPLYEEIREITSYPEK